MRDQGVANVKWVQKFEIANFANQFASVQGLLYTVLHVFMQTHIADSRKNT
jgi:hypothetical protein